MQAYVKRNSFASFASFASVVALFALPLASPLLLTPTLARADEAAPAAPAAIEEAKGHYRRARELYEEGNFRGALVEMKRSYELSKNPKLLFDLGQISYQLQDYPAALDAFTRYLASNAGSIAPQRLEEVQKDIEKLKSRIGTLRITANRPGVHILVDDVDAGVAPLATPVRVGAGRHKISGTINGKSAVPKVVDVAGGETVEVSLAFADGEPAAPPADKPGPRAEEPGGGGGKTAAIAGWAITGGLGVATAVTGVLALSRSSRLKSDLDTAGITRAQIDADRSAGKTTALVTDVLLGATIVGAVVSTVITVKSKPAPRAPEAAVSLRLGPGYAGVAGSF